MVIDPRLYEKVSGRSGDPARRLGEALAKDAKAKSRRDELPKGVTGGLRVTRIPGIVAQLWLFSRLGRRSKD